MLPFSYVFYVSYCEAYCRCCADARWAALLDLVDCESCACEASSPHIASLVVSASDPALREGPKRVVCSE